MGVRGFLFSLACEVTLAEIIFRVVLFFVSAYTSLIESVCVIQTGERDGYETQ
jgi:hypothetical protein